MKKLLLSVFITLLVFSNSSVVLAREGFFSFLNLPFLRSIKDKKPPEKERKEEVEKLRRELEERIRRAEKLGKERKKNEKAEKLISTEIPGFSFDESFTVRTNPSDLNSEELLKIFQEMRKEIYTFLELPEKISIPEPVRLSIAVRIDPKLEAPEGDTWVKDHPKREAHLVWIHLPSGCTEDEKKCIAAHEITHALLENITKDGKLSSIGGGLSSFEHEGIAGYIEFKTAKDPTVLLEQRVKTIKRLINAKQKIYISDFKNQKITEEDHEGYAIGQYFIDFLVELGGGKKLGNFIKCRAKYNFEECLYKVYGITNIDKRYSDWLLEKFGKK